MDATGIGGPEGALTTAMGVWKLHSAESAMERGSKQYCEALSESSDQASLGNFLGVLPFGDHFDDASEPTPYQYFKGEFKNIISSPFELMRQLGAIF